jgi:flagellar capping protein FliD
MKNLAEVAKIRQEKATATVAESKKSADEARKAQQIEVNRLTSIQNKLAKDLASAKNVRIKFGTKTTIGTSGRESCSNR